MSIAFLLGLEALCLQSSLSAQSTFIALNFAPSAGVDAPVYDGAGNRVSGTNYLAVLYGGLTASSLDPVAEYEPLGAPLAPMPFTHMPNGQTGYFRHSSRVVVASVPVGQLAWLQVRAWDARLGATYEDVVALGLGGCGASPLFQAYGASLAFPPPTLGYLIGLESFSLLPIVPEPNVAWLVALGLPWLIYRHRRKPPGNGASIKGPGRIVCFAKLPWPR